MDGCQWFVEEICLTESKSDKEYFNYNGSYQECVFFIYNVLFDSIRENAPIIMKTEEGTYKLNAQIITDIVNEVFPDRLV